MRQGQGSQRFDRPRRLDMSLRKGTGVGALLMGLVGFGLGLFFGWLLHRERVSGTGTTTDLTTTALADTSARLELADRDVIDLRAQLTDAQHLLDERTATIAQLEAELMAYRERSYGEEIAAEPAGVEEVEEMDAATVEIVDAAADAATAPDTPLVASQFAVDEVDVTDEVLVVQDDVTEVELAEDVVAEEPAVEVELAEQVVAEEPAVEVVPAEPVEEMAEPAEPVVAEEPAEPVVAEPVEPVVAEPAEAEQPEVAEAPVDDALLDDAAATGPAVASTAAAPSDDTADSEPFVLPRDAERDDLRRIRGIGPTMERLLNEQGIVTFRQLAVLSDPGIEELQRRLPGVSGRIRRGQWIQQARDLHVQTHGDQH
jgi:predicted flap endonuclease-1-like 5' DNA nuclease